MRESERSSESSNETPEGARPAEVTGEPQRARSRRSAGTSRSRAGQASEAGATEAGTAKAGTTDAGTARAETARADTAKAGSAEAGPDAGAGPGGAGGSEGGAAEGAPAHQRRRRGARAADATGGARAADVGGADASQADAGETQRAGAAGGSAQAGAASQTGQAGAGTQTGQAGAGGPDSAGAEAERPPSRRRRAASRAAGPAAQASPPATESGAPATTPGGPAGGPFAGPFSAEPSAGETGGQQPPERAGGVPLPTFQPPPVVFQPPAPGSAAESRDRRGQAAPAESAEGGGRAGQAEGEPGETEREEGRRRRRRGGRSRGRDGAETEPAAEPAESATEAAEAGDQAEAGEEDEGGSRRRRRRRRRSGSPDTDQPAGDEPPNTVVHIRVPRKTAEDAAPADEVQSVRGSTRLEAKRQRRREGRDSGRRRPPVITESEFLARREAVDRIMIVRQQGERTQIGVLEDGVLVEHYVDKSSHQSLVGNVYLGKVQNVLPSMEAAFVDIGKGRNAVLYAGEVNFDASGLEGESKRIESALKSGQSVLVQVTKDPVGHKGARLTSQVSLPGRYLVYVPGGSMMGISRKLPDKERTRLKQILKQVMPDGAGVIVRTAAEGAAEDELAHDVARLAAQWEAIEQRAKSANAPELLYSEPDLTIRVVRDIFNEDFSKLVVAGGEAWDLVDEYVRYVAPNLAERLSHWQDGDDVFAEYRIDEQLAKALDRKVWLPSGGSLVIDKTEAMTVIDVNTGKFTGQGGNLEQTVTRNNLEAAEEIVRQLRLRDVGGIIVIDFIDMVLESNRELVLRRLLECLARDRTKHQVAEVTSLGLVQMTRKRVGTGLLEAFSQPCDCCNGRGVLVSTDLTESATAGSRGRGGRDEGRAGQGGRRGRNGKTAEREDTGRGGAAAQETAAGDGGRRRRAAGAGAPGDAAAATGTAGDGTAAVESTAGESTAAESTAAGRAASGEEGAAQAAGVAASGEAVREPVTGGQSGAGGQAAADGGDRAARGGRRRAAVRDQAPPPPAYQALAGANGGGIATSGSQAAGPETAAPQPSGAEHSGAEHSGAEPSGAGPSGTEPSGTEPSGTEPAEAAPEGAQQPATPESPARSQAAAASEETAAAPGSAEAEPGPAPAGAGPGDAGPAEVEPSDAGPAGNWSADAGPADAGPAGSWSADAGPADAGPSGNWSADAGPADAGPAGSWSSDAGPADAGPAGAGPVGAGWQGTVFGGAGDGLGVAQGPGSAGGSSGLDVPAGPGGPAASGLFAAPLGWTEGGGEPGGPDTGSGPAPTVPPAESAWTGAAGPAAGDSGPGQTEAAGPAAGDSRAEQAEPDDSAGRPWYGHPTEQLPGQRTLDEAAAEGETAADQGDADGSAPPAAG